MTARSPAKQVAGFLAKFEPEIARRARAVRAELRRRFPTAVELVYDNYNALALGFGSSERASDCIVSLVVAPRAVSLCYIYGATLPDPRKILQGGGNQTRFVRLAGPATLAEPAVADLLRAAVEQARTPLPASGRGYTVVKSVSAKQRPRRAAAKGKQNE